MTMLSTRLELEDLVESVEGITRYPCWPEKVTGTGVAAWVEPGAPYGVIGQVPSIMVWEYWIRVLAPLPATYAASLDTMDGAISALLLTISQSMFSTLDVEQPNDEQRNGIRYLATTVRVTSPRRLES
jgi:hypothetical protein